ncbi:hypothetical protein EMIHUDRAFT_234448 [Emiliania huxleyi CCMP1516]|uniref:Uncharacterized protein n=2 Tax=Emiliania huxleyi TaxID=2903 RepID=A0A0D3JZI1_EMIH1|nr:hypothetical protein EMIHUDRAFT_234448 [Emiliania huxleyi CCMP1516]EOD28916.1 hypothetical protein EMIHUDRAFT_234448 [Emiliania huxleyi CCMP1516]|eukprot:XP_005781345.1 hypothetical protein EMIHUDRAFT_234448 [Emiliania huxleyi CCMP1516]
MLRVFHLTTALINMLLWLRWWHWTPYNDRLEERIYTRQKNKNNKRPTPYAA